MLYTSKAQSVATKTIQSKYLLQILSLCILSLSVQVVASLEFVSPSSSLSFLFFFLSWIMFVLITFYFLSLESWLYYFACTLRVFATMSWFQFFWNVSSLNIKFKLWSVLFRNIQMTILWEKKLCVLIDHREEIELAIVLRGWERNFGKKKTNKLSTSQQEITNYN